MVLQGSGRVTAWGLNLNRRASVPSTVVDAVAIVASFNNSAVALRSGSIIIFGSNLDQALVTRTVTRTPTPTP